MLRRSAEGYNPKMQKPGSPPGSKITFLHQHSPIFFRSICGAQAPSPATLSLLLLNLSVVNKIRTYFSIILHHFYKKSATLCLQMPSQGGSAINKAALKSPLDSGEISAKGAKESSPAREPWVNIDLGSKRRRCGTEVLLYKVHAARLFND
jgi:hypothetical protein